MNRLPLIVPVLLFFVLVSISPSTVASQPKEVRPPSISGGAEASDFAQRVEINKLKGSPDEGSLRAFVPGVGFLAYNYDNNATETGGFTLIPPDPCGAAGTDRVLAVVNVGIECRDKTGTLLWRDALKDFFSPLGAQTLGTLTFDPKVVYDHYENRFVVVTLERLRTSAGDPTDDSRILVAVSKTATPASSTASDWWYLSINSKLNISGNFYWADYPGFEIDEEAVYITNNMFPFSSGNVFTRLWIIDKGVVGGFYAGATASWNVHNPIPAGFFDMTLQPALVFGAGGAGTNIGTYLCGYSSLTSGGPGATEAAQIIRIDNPLSGPTFTGQFVGVGDLEDVGGVFGFPNIPDAPQSGTTSLIEVNDSRALDAVWRNNSLWFTTTINPNTANDATNAGQATAHWFRIDTTAPASLSLADQGNIGGEDIASTTSTFFPAVAVNGAGDAKFGFSASASSIYGGAYMAGRHPTDTAGTVQASAVVQAGLDYYLRTFGAGRNRWGDYSGAAVDPSDDSTFWIFNEYAETRGSGTAPEDGRWGTAWKSCAPTSQTDFGDAPDPTYPTLLASNGARHTIVPGVFMGLQIDGEPNGLPHPNALGDDITALADEDGVVQLTPFVPGQLANVQVTTSMGGWLDAWFDWNQNGSWADPGELVFSGPVAPGVNAIGVNVPIGALPGLTFARFRYNLGGALPFAGPAPNGEVEDYQFPVEDPQELDFGDAPDPSYPTLLASNGANHNIVPGVLMGGLIDAEPDGQPDPNAMGDDISNQPDEDGVVFVSPFIPGQPAQVDVNVSMNGWLDAWFDWNQNGSWLDPGELVYSGPVVAGLNQIPFGVPAGALPGMTFARFRYNTVGALPVTGNATDGEVEDYEVPVEEPQELDFGDAPDPSYPTLLASNGANHNIVPGVLMGGLIDAELDGQPDPNAMGDDLSNLPDEDGVAFVSPVVLGQSAQVDVTVSMNGWLDAWFDWNQNGSWLDAGEQVFSGPVVTGLNQIPFNVPAGALPGLTFARFRYNTAGALPVTGNAVDGEVEDYEVPVEEPQFDFGDAPDPSYPTLLANNGANHNIVPGVLMGGQIDSEPDGQPDATATGDDLANLADEDGVLFVSPIIPAQSTQVDVTVSMNGWLDAWFDWNQNGSWLDAGELVYSGPVVAGLNQIPFVVPAGALPGATFARFRYNTAGALPVTGNATDGEVEDYEVAVEEPEYDFGDAPDPTYPTLLTNNGANHLIVSGVFMGSLIDGELNGQPDSTATGDDLANLADEDGVVFTSLLNPTQTANVNVTVSAAGFLDAWVDFDSNGVWDPADQIFTSTPLVVGVNSLAFNVPPIGKLAPAFTTFARFRYSTSGGLQPTGSASDGEVEDYKVQIEQDVITSVGGVPAKYALHDAVPNPFNPRTTLSFSLPAAEHVRLKVYDVRGTLVATLLDEPRGPGRHDVVWDGQNDQKRQVSTGLYICRIQAGSFVESKRIVLLK